MLQDTSLDFKLVQRICLLQQALDQAMDTLADLQQRVEDHQMLESHLAQTEEYSNVQQKIILNLQQQLSAKAQWQQQVLERVLTQVKHLIDGQQIELERLRARTYQSQAELQTYLLRLKDQSQARQPPLTSVDMMTSEVMLARNLTVNLCGQLQTAQQHIYQLDKTLTRYQVMFAQMKVQARAVREAVDENLIPSSSALTSETAYDDDPADWETLGDPVALQAIVDAQHQKIKELGIELNQQFQHQTQLKQWCQIVAAERDQAKQSVTVLKIENERLQAQLAQQQVENEYLQAELQAQPQLNQLPWSALAAEEPEPQACRNADQDSLSSTCQEPAVQENSHTNPEPPEQPLGRLPKSPRQPAARPPIPKWRAHNQDPNPLFRFKPGLY